MIGTLKTYLAKDLAKVTVMATVVVTVIMAVLAVIQPLRDRGLSGNQALKLFCYILPVMFSLTLPVAGLFAATIVYGRFSRDNELMASRASGICTLSVLRPAIWLGVIVSVATLLLSLWVAPQLLRASQRSFKADLKQAAYHCLMTKRHLKLQRNDLIIHADRVDPKSGWLGGVVVVEHSDEMDAKVAVAASAKPEFVERGDETHVVFHCTNPDLMRQSGLAEIRARKRLFLRHGKLPNPLKDKPKFYDWPKLCRIHAQPMTSSIVREELVQIQRQICIQRFYRDVTDTIRAGKAYRRLAELAPPDEDEQGVRVELAAGSTSLNRKNEMILSPPSPRTTTMPATAAAAPSAVEVRVFRGDELRKQFLARRARLKAEWKEYEQAVVVSLIMEGARGPGMPAESAGHREYPMGPFAVPKDIVAEAEQINLDDLVSSPEQYELSRKVTDMVNNLHDKLLPKLLRKISAEMHWRIAYGVCCLLMVLIGAAMGLILRGGQVLAAMAISAVPAALVIVLLLAGKELIQNPKVTWGYAYGVAVIWGGVGLMAAAAGYLYAGPMRR